MTWFFLELNMDFFMLDVEIAWTQKIGYGKIMSTTLPWTHIKIYKRTKSGLQMHRSNVNQFVIVNFLYVIT